MKIAIIDSGLDSNCDIFATTTIEGNSVQKIDGEYVWSNDYEDFLGHGTGVASIIIKNAPDAHLVIVKIFHDSLVVELDTLIESIKWCLGQYDIKIINLSLGIRMSNPPAELHDVCKLAYNKGIVIISAAHYIRSEACYPAYFPEVLGVTSGNVRRKNTFGFIDNSPIEFVAKGMMQRVTSLNNEKKMVEGTSYACAHFSAIVYSFLNLRESISVDSLKNHVKEMASAEVKPTQFIYNERKAPLVISNSLSEICKKHFNSFNPNSKWGRVALFPISEKEINTMLDFPNHCQLEITKYLDYPRRLVENKGSYDIQDWDLNDNDIYSFDTLVSGFFREHLFEGNRLFGERILEKSIAHHKNIITFNKEIAFSFWKEYPDFKGKLYCPMVESIIYKDLENFRYHKCLTKPIICVVGTSNRQGKFTTQIRIKEILQREGYKITHISSEPQGELLGADFVFSYGRGSTVIINKSDWAYFLDNLLKGLEYYTNPDLIITGTQGSSLPLSDEPLPNAPHYDSITYLSGIRPDAVICCINPNDNIKDILDTVNMIEILFKAKTLFFTMTPWLRDLNHSQNTSFFSYRFLNTEEMDERMNHYAEQLGNKVFDIMRNQYDEVILNLIEQFFVPKQSIIHD
jgi:hypothetical protein